MPTFEIEAGGRVFEVDAPDMQTATRAAQQFAQPAQPVPPAPAELPSTVSPQPLAGGPVIPWAMDMLSGAVKGAGRSVLGAGAMVKSAAGLGEMSPEDQVAFSPSTWGLDPASRAEKVGQGIEQAAEFVAIPGPAKLRGASLAARGLEAAKVGGAAAGLAKVQGASDAGAVATGALTALPVGQGIAAAGKWIGKRAEPLVRSAIKPTVAAMQKVAGASVSGIEAQAQRLIRFILENGVTSAEKAGRIVTEAERELHRLLAVKNAPTDAPTRAVRYLESLEKQAAKQGLPAQDVATIRNAAAEVLESGLGEDVVKMVPRPHPTLVDPSGRPITVLVPETTRALRQSVPAAEALERARASSRWDTRKAWGEQKGAQKEAGKAVERALRDAVKAAVPEARPILQRQGMAIQAQKALDRAEFRAANRDAVSLPAHVVAAGELASGRPPVLAIAANWLRDNQLKAGIYADRLAKAIERGNVPEVVFYLQKIGVGGGAQLGAASK